MKTIHKNLIFDHLYMATSEPEFEEIKKIFLPFDCASHQIVKADDDSWEGVYVRTRGQNYFEFLKLRRSGGIGLCQRAYSILTQDARSITQEFPELPWKSFDRSLAGQKWFTALSCENYLDLTTPFNTWVMHYYPRETNNIVELRKCEISQFHEIHFSAHPDLIERVKLNSTWFNSKSEFTNKEAHFQLQTYYSDQFWLKITFDNKDAGFRFKRATMTFEPGVEVADLDLSYYRFYKKGSIHVFEKKNFE